MRYLIEALLNPFFIAFVLLLIALLLTLPAKSSYWIRGLLAMAVLILLVFSTVWFPRSLTHYLESAYPVVRNTNPAIKYIVVLSGGQSNDSTLPANMQLYGASQQRLWEGLRLYRQIPGAVLVLSGGGYNGLENPEAQQLAQLSQWCKIKADRILLEKNARNTWEQARELKKMIGSKPFYLVTSAIHMPRAMRSMQKQGMHPIAAPTDFTRYWQDERWPKRYIPNPYNLVYSSIVLHELLGRAYYAYLARVIK